MPKDKITQARKLPIRDALMLRVEELNKRRAAGEPDWIWNTPDETSYVLWMHRADEEQEILLTRDEFISLKAHLAELRGYAPAPPVPDFKNEKEVAHAGN